MNVAILRGRLSSEPRLRTLPSGDRLVALELTVPVEGNRADSVPVTWFDPPAAAEAWPAGQELVVVGRVRRRFFRAAGARASRTEVQAATVVPAARRAAVAKAVGRAVAELEHLHAAPMG